MEATQWSGLLPANDKGDKYLFYWLFAPDTATYTGAEGDIPLLIWLNGGPGCSSMDGLFLENGPLELKAQGGSWKLTGRAASWHKAPAYVVYLDQPVGTGLSFTTSNTYPGNDHQVNSDFYYWLIQFLKLHADKFLTTDHASTRRKLFFSGESHAGHYIPSMMAYIQNQKNPPIQITLSGAAIGNGWIDPYHQYAAAAAAYGHGIIDFSLKRALDLQEANCQAELKKKNYRSSVCFNLLDEIVDQSYGSSSEYKVSQYDVSKPESKSSDRTFPPGHKNVESYLGGAATAPGLPAMNAGVEAVLTALNALPSRQAGQVFQECTDPPYNALSHQDGVGVTDDVIQLLNSKTKMLFFNGMLDLICNHVGNEVLLEELNWDSRSNWMQAPRYSWTASSQNPAMGVSGYVKEYGPLVFLKVKGAGHMVPMDLPDIGLDMMKTFMYGGSFDTSKQELDRRESSSSPAPKACPVCPECKTDNSSTNQNEPSQKNPSGLPGQDENPVLGFVIAHSWLGAIFAVMVFLAVLIAVRRRQARLGTYSDVEMNAQYRDDPVPTFLDDDEESEPKTERRMV